jgi:hypothetical protein
LKTADDALQLACASAEHDTGERDQATEECKGLWLGHRLHGGEAAAVCVNQYVVSNDCRVTVDGEFRQVLDYDFCDRAIHVSINNGGIEIQKVEGGAVE